MRSGVFWCIVDSGATVSYAEKDKALVRRRFRLYVVLNLGSKRHQQ